VSDEDFAIIDSVKAVLPNAVHSFCVFHQLEKLTGIYLDKFKSKNNIPEQDKEFYELCKELILAKDAINSSVIFKQLQDISSSRRLSYASREAMKYAAEVYGKNRKLMEKGFVPETNNTAEQLFSVFNDFAIICRSLKVHSGLRNWASNLFLLTNHRSFNTGLNRGLSPLQISRSYG
jgi:MULE transposase domain.